MTFYSISEPRVSVLMPAFNSEKTIAASIRSALLQTMPDLEIIAVDDASTDTTAEIVDSFAKSDSRVRLIRLERNVGCAAARQIALEGARAAWICALDADDGWVPDHLEVCLSLALDNGIFIADETVAGRPSGDTGLLVPDALSRTHPHVEELPDFCSYLKLGMDVKPLFPRHTLERLGEGKLFPAWASGGEWAYAIAKLFAMGLKGKLLRRPGNLYRVSGRHNSSTLRAIREQLVVNEYLSSADHVSESAKDILRNQRPSIRRRLGVAALRERRYGAFLHYLARDPAVFYTLPASAYRYLLRQVRWRVGR